MLRIVRVKQPTVKFITYISPSIHRESLGIQGNMLPFTGDAGRDTWDGLADRVIKGGQHEVLNALLWSL